LDHQADVWIRGLSADPGLAITCSDGCQLSFITLQTSSTKLLPFLIMTPSPKRWPTTFLALWFTPSLAEQPSAPKPYAAPLRDLQFGQLNFLHTTDTHGWHAGHLLEASYAADWGDYIDFSARLREKLESDGQDLLVIDTGDRIEGNGLYDASDPKGKYTFDIFTQQHIDVICSGNHELYKQNSSENEFTITVPAYKDSYIASNLDIYDPATGDIVPLAPRYKNFTTKVNGLRIVAFGFLYDFQSNYKNTIVTPVEDAIKQSWFQNAIRDRNVDLFLVIGHAAVRSAEFAAIFKEIRAEQWDVPIQFFGGHFHIRDYKKFDSMSYALASGRFMETIGFQSIDGLTTKSDGLHVKNSVKFSRRYIDNNLFSLYHHSGHNESSFHSEKGRRVSKMIHRGRTALNLDETVGCAPDNLWMSRARYPSNSSIFTWLEREVLPEAVNDTAREGEARLILLNTGAIRFDIFKGAFTKDSTFIVSPFTSGFHYIPNVPYSKAKDVLKLLNSGGEMLEAFQDLMPLSNLAPPQQLGIPNNIEGSDHSHQDQILLGSGLSGFDNLQPGYTTKDDGGDDGDDTIHAPISFYRVPNCIQATVNAGDKDLEESNIDLVFNEFIQAYILIALKFLGLEYSDADVLKYMYGKDFTALLAEWVDQNWSGNC
jgi:2',3'-cyclic-nucleotide 2'-phosphodiesterase (5'-nucleotidase family)